jgi:hypothetical protein
MNIFINNITSNHKYFINDFTSLDHLSNYKILEFTFYPDIFPSITSYYLMNKEQIDYFLYIYSELKNNPINNFFNDKILTINNTKYYIYDDHQDNNYNILYNYIKLTLINKSSCDLISYIYKLFNKNNEDIQIDTELECLDDIYKNTDDISNILDIYIKMKDKCILNCLNIDNSNYCDICLNSIKNIKTIYNNNNNIIKDEDIKELINEINKK